MQITKSPKLDINNISNHTKKLQTKEISIDLLRFLTSKILFVNDLRQLGLIWLNYTIASSNNVIKKDGGLFTVNEKENWQILYNLFNNPKRLDPKYKSLKLIDTNITTQLGSAITNNVFNRERYIDLKILKSEELEICVPIYITREKLYGNNFNIILAPNSKPSPLIPFMPMDPMPKYPNGKKMTSPNIFITSDTLKKELKTKLNFYNESFDFTKEFFDAKNTSFNKVYIQRYNYSNNIARTPLSSYQHKWYSILSDSAKGDAYNTFDIATLLNRNNIASFVKDNRIRTIFSSKPELFLLEPVTFAYQALYSATMEKHQEITKVIEPHVPDYVAEFYHTIIPGIKKVYELNDKSLNNAAIVKNDNLPTFDARIKLRESLRQSNILPIQELVDIVIGIHSNEFTKADTRPLIKVAYTILEQMEERTQEMLSLVNEIVGSMDHLRFLSEL